MKHRIKEVLEGLNITQRALAEKTGLTEAGVSKMIANETASKSSLMKIANALSIDLEELADSENALLAKFGSDKTPLKLGLLEIPCYVLEDGTRVFSGRGIQRLFGESNKSGSWLSTLVNQTLKDELEEIKSGEKTALYKMQHPVKFYRKDAGGSQPITYGYEATLLIDLCDAIIKSSEKEGEVPKSYVMTANVIIRAVAKTGIIALVDEATGYDKEKTRAKDELQKILKGFLREEAAKWVKQFDDQFFEDIYKMRHWTWTNTSKKPGVVGTWIKDIVYDRLAPVLPALETLNPKNSKGNRAYKHHQFLSADFGIPKLKQHLEAVHAIAELSNYDWETFKRNLDKVYPRKYSELYLDCDE